MILTIIGVAITAGFFAVRSVHDYKKERYTIGILKSGDHPALDMTTDGVMAQLKYDLDNPKIIYESAQSDNNLAQQIIQKFIQQRVNIIVTVGTTATQLAQQRTHAIPIVFASVTDPVGGGIIQKLDHPEGNVTGISNFSPNITEKQFEFYKILLPNMRTLAVIYNSGESNSVFMVEKIKSVASQYDIAIKELVIQSTNDAVFGVKSLIGTVDAILVDNDNTALGAIKGIIDIASKANIPLLCSDLDTIKLGSLVVIGPDQYKLGEQAGEMVVRIIRDKVPVSDIPTIFATDIRYVVNKNVAEKLNITIPDGAEVYEGQ